MILSIRRVVPSRTAIDAISSIPFGIEGRPASSTSRPVAASAREIYSSCIFGCALTTTLAARRSSSTLRSPDLWAAATASRAA
eukprot:scaffold279654_cov27-Tisochrysis_lutea.AAC.4